MEEATRLCSRIGIIDHGRILALGTRDALLARLPFEDEITFAAAPGVDGFVQALAPLGPVTTDNGLHRFRPAPAVRMSEFYALAEQHGVAARAFTHERPSLEAVFLHLTGRTLRE
jgi:ABC-2 type transport system ATP-binding protein